MLKEREMLVCHSVVSCRAVEVKVRGYLGEVSVFLKVCCDCSGASELYQVKSTMHEVHTPPPPPAGL